MRLSRLSHPNTRDSCRVFPDLELHDAADRRRVCRLIAVIAGACGTGLGRVKAALEAGHGRKPLRARVVESLVFQSDVTTRGRPPHAGLVIGHTACAGNVDRLSRRAKTPPIRSDFAALLCHYCIYSDVPLPVSCPPRHLWALPLSRVAGASKDSCKQCRSSTSFVQVDCDARQ